MNSKLTARIGARKSHRGQGMTEYIIIVALVAIGAIGVYNFFGKTVRDQTSAMACGLAGNTCATTQTGTATTDATSSASTADTKQGLSNFGDKDGNQ
jgi:Flp pilus assembly pilin Flp